jgi:prepilin-type N-terminal cleavage/methylation domain-containing protein
MSHNRQKRANETGFTLLEMAIVLMVVALLVAMGIQLQKSGIQANQAAVQRAQLRQAHAFLVQHALLGFRLPCPDVTGSGVESVQADQVHCQANLGWLPYITLGLQMPNGQGGDTVMRYGVYRGATDVAMTLGGVDSPTKAKNFADSLSQAMLNPPTIAYPYVPTHSDCSNAKLNPAFALALGAQTLTEGWRNCFMSGQAIQVDVESLSDLQTQIVDIERRSGL